MFKTKLEAVKDLVTHDHAFLKPEYVKMVCKPFEIDPKKFIYKAQDRRSEFKGLYCPDVKEGDWVEGADADDLAHDLCHELGVKYRPMFGRGSGLRECCRALIEHLSK